MSLIKSISGFRGTLGGVAGENLTPVDIVKFAYGYAEFLKKKFPAERLRVCVGRDARISGEMVSQITAQTLCACGIDVTDLGLSTTPTVEMAVPALKAHGGIILTASHNPAQWNALKLLNEKGEFISAEDGQLLLSLSDAPNPVFVPVEELGKVTPATFIDAHIDAVLKYPLVNVAAIQAAGFKVVVDAVASTGGITIPNLLQKLGVEVIELHCQPTGMFPHNPEPLPENLHEISDWVKQHGADLGVVVDPDVDRLALVCEDGSLFGEEYTLVAVADYVLGKRPGNTVSNLSSSRALRDVTEKHNGRYVAAAVGEVNVVAQMKEVQAVIGGEGNGGIIVPDFHYGRDALIGVALFLSLLAERKIKASELRATYPAYFMGKMKVDLQPGMDTAVILNQFHDRYAHLQVNTVDGVKIDFEMSWVHLRRSNTEPIIRVYTEAPSQEEANTLGNRFVEEIKLLAQNTVV